MTTTMKMLWGVLALCLVGALVILSMWNIPAPSGEIRKVITVKDLGRT